MMRMHRIETPNQTRRHTQSLAAHNPITTISRDALLILIPMQLEVSDMLRIDYRRPNSTADGMRGYMVGEDLIQDAFTDPLLGQRLYDALSSKLRWATNAFSHFTIADFARLWREEKTSAHGARLSGVLWTVARSSALGFRRLECTMYMLSKCSLNLI